LTRVDNKGLFVKNTLKVTKGDINAESRRIRNVANPKKVQMQLIFQHYWYTRMKLCSYLNV
jgi:hypothetical protein